MLIYLDLCLYTDINISLLIEWVTYCMLGYIRLDWVRFWLIQYTILGWTMGKFRAQGVHQTGQQSIIYLVLFIIYNFVNSRVSRVPSKVLIYTGSLMPTADMRFPLIFSAQFSPRTEEDLSNRNLPQNLKGERFKVCKPGISDKRCHFWILRFSLWEWNLLQNYTVQER